LLGVVGHGLPIAVGIKNFWAGADGRLGDHGVSLRGGSAVLISRQLI
jgi:hypothetical protein